MDNKILNSLRQRARRFNMTIRVNYGEEGGYRLLRRQDEFDAFGGSVDLEDISERLQKEEEARY